MMKEQVSDIIDGKYERDSAPPLPSKYSKTTFFLNSKLYFAIKIPTSKLLDFGLTFCGRYK